MTEEKYTIRKYKRILFYVVICVLLAAFLLGQYIYPSERETVTKESITYIGTFYRVLVTMGAKLDQTMYIDHIDKAMECMEKAIRQNIRKNDICT